MPTWLLIVLIVLVVIVIVLLVLYLLGRRNQKKQEAQDEEIRKQAQPMSFYIIDMKRLRLKEAGMPKAMYDATPKLARLSKVPILKVKIGNRVMNLMCDPQVYKTLLPKQEVKAMVAGMYVVSAKRVRGPVVEPKLNKKGEPKVSILDRLR